MASRPAVLVTAGPTREKIDPIRFISNYATGTFGYEIAAAARAKGCRVTLVSGPTPIKPPSGVKVIRIESALEMCDAVLSEIGRHRILIMAAAVSDWRPAILARRKIKKGAEAPLLRLIENPDILKEAASIAKAGTVIVGFSLETGDLEKNARLKLRSKHLDFIVGNKAAGGTREKPFGAAKTDILIIDRFGKKEAYRGRTKAELAKIILDKALNLTI